MTSSVLGISLLAAALPTAATSSPARPAEPTPPRVEWQVSAENVPARISELVEFGRAYQTDDAKLVVAVGGLKEWIAAKKAPPAWSKKTSWIEASGPNPVYFGVGVFSGAPTHRPLAFVVAENRARVEIAKLQNVTIVRRSEANGWRSVTTTTTATLADVVIVDWYTEGTTIYALAAYSKPVTLEPDAPWIP